MSIDVSASRLGDEGLLKLMDTLVTSCDELLDQEDNLSICLEARMNGVGSLGASKLFDRIVNSKDNGKSTEGETEVNIEEEVAVAEDERHTDIIMDVDVLDIGLNDLEAENADSKEILQMHLSVQELVEHNNAPRILRLDACGLGGLACRAIGKGLTNRHTGTDKVSQNKDSYEDESSNAIEKEQLKPTFTSDRQTNGLRELYLSGNDGISDGGTAALAAALKLARGVTDDSSTPILDNLDLSSCQVGDGGAGALAVALQSNPGCLTRLDLSNNKITNTGAISLSTALKEGHKKSKRDSYLLDELDLSNNVDIDGEGAEALVAAVTCGAVRKLSLRSCSIRWRGASALGSALGKMLIDQSRQKQSSSQSSIVEIDLSGNKLGKKSKEKKSATSAIYTSSTKTVISGINFLGNRIKSGLKDVGLSNVVGSSLESDDEAEEEDDTIGSELTSDLDESTIKCGACAFYDAFADSVESSKSASVGLTIKIGMRMCNFDNQAIDALAATCVLAGDDFKSHLCIDCNMNKGSPDFAVQDLQSGNFKSSELTEMADDHLAALKILQEARESAEAESRVNDLFSFGGDFDDDGYNAYDDYEQSY
eukprot:CAMPEP_0194123564 /NCGR_PEP_ID=MMETSP0150-20130528/55044_1 /TAXON_ID=122233 /ORGANISM="Chaetoceros debilis, Strain MM31A-1" /LENGTH=595 /DNA_ID=CAMNT_0038816861 /DNA_START=258 /DNA_END=2045 /DNA_ORIENTATION=+